MYVKGQSGNPAGRPKGTRQFARLVQDKTDKGNEIVRVVLEILHGEHGATASDRIQAARFLAERGWGKICEAPDYDPAQPLAAPKVNIIFIENERVKNILGLAAANGIICIGSNGHNGNGHAKGNGTSKPN